MFIYKIDILLIPIRIFVERMISVMEETLYLHKWNLEIETGGFGVYYLARRLERWPADPRAPCGATTAGHLVL